MQPSMECTFPVLEPYAPKHTSVVVGPFEKMLPELWALVFEEVLGEHGSAKDIEYILHVSKAWKDMALPIFWRHLSFMSPEKLVADAADFDMPHRNACISRWTRSITVLAPGTTDIIYFRFMHILADILSKPFYLRAFNMIDNYLGPLSPTCCTLLRRATANSLQTLSVRVEWASEAGNSCLADLCHFPNLRALAVSFCAHRQDDTAVIFDIPPWVFSQLVALKLTHCVPSIMSAHMEQLWCFLKGCTFPRLSSFAMDTTVQGFDREVQTDDIEQFFKQQPGIAEVDLKFNGVASGTMMNTVLPYLTAPRVRLSLSCTPACAEALSLLAPSTVTGLQLEVNFWDGFKESIVDFLDVLFPKDQPSPVSSVRSVLIRYSHDTRFTWAGKGPRRYEELHTYFMARLTEYVIRLQKHGVKIEDEEGAQCKLVPTGS